MGDSDRKALNHSTKTHLCSFCLQAEPVSQTSCCSPQLMHLMKCYQVPSYCCTSQYVVGVMLSAHLCHVLQVLRSLSVGLKWNMVGAENKPGKKRYVACYMLYTIHVKSNWATILYSVSHPHLYLFFYLSSCIKTWSFFRLDLFLRLLLFYYMAYLIPLLDYRDILALSSAKEQEQVDEDDSSRLEADLWPEKIWSNDQVSSYSRICFLLY